MGVAAHVLILPEESGADDREDRGDASRGPRIYLVPAGHFALHGDVKIPARARALEIDSRFLRDVSGQPFAEGTGIGAAWEIKIRAIAERLARAGELARPSAAVVDALSVALARTLGRSFGRVAPRRDDAWMNPGTLERLVTMVDDGYAPQDGAAGLASVAGLSGSAFLRAFRGVLGVTPWEYVITRRIELATRLLLDTDEDIASIAARTGFGSASHFATTFRRRRGLTPTDFRRRGAGLNSGGEVH